jgi:hypothetical protein
VRTVPGVRKAVKWNSPLYGVEGQAPISNSIALRVSGLKLENSCSVSNPSERIRASIVRRALRVIEDPCHLSVALFDDLVDIEVALMSALAPVVHDTLDLGKHSFAVAFERERVHPPQDLPVGFHNYAWHGADSFIVEAERRNGPDFSPSRSKLPVHHEGVDIAECRMLEG